MRAPYDEENPINNLIKMHKMVQEARAKEKEENRERDEEEAKADLEKKKKKAEKAKKEKDKDFKLPPLLDYILKLTGGLKLEIKRLHFRYEDDFF